jgi:hypothetical protein
MEQLNYQPVSFQGIVPQLDVGDPSQSFVASMQGTIAGEQANLQQMARNAQVENMNLKTKLDGLQSLAQFSGKAFETYVNISNQNLKNRLAEVWAENFNQTEPPDIKEYEADEAEAKSTQQKMGEGMSETLNNRKDPTAEEIANAGKMRNYTGLEAIVAHNARAKAAMDSYPTALENWLAKPQFSNLEPGPQYQAAVNEFNRLWADQTGLAAANPQFSAKYIYPTLRKQALQQKEQFTRQWNVRHADEQLQVLTQQVESGELTLSSFFQQQTGLTKSDGKTLRTYEDGWAALSRSNFTTDELTKLGTEKFELTGKPYSEHPRFQALLRDARNRRLQDDSLKNRQYSIDSRDGFRSLGADASRQDMEFERDRQLALGIPIDIVDSNLNASRRSSFEATQVREWTDKINTWLTSNPGKKIPYDVIADAPFQVKQQFKGQMEPDANAATTEELIRNSQEFKDLSKDMKGTLKQIIPGMSIASEAQGTTDPVNFNAFKGAALTNIVQRAQVLMLGESGMSLQDALTTAKQEWQENAETLHKEGKLFDSDTNSFKQLKANVGLAQATRMMAQQLEQTTLTDLSKGLYESDYTQPPVQGRYSERVRFLARRYGMRPKQIVDMARKQQQLPPLNSTPVDDVLGMVDPVMDRRINSLDTSSATAAIRAQIRSNQRLSGNAKDRTIAVGQQLLTLGIRGIWQHPDFSYDSGFTGSGSERVARRDRDSYHHYEEALDIGLNGNGRRKLDLVYAYLLKNKERFGIDELIWDPDNLRNDGHDDHVHVSFK